MTLILKVTISSLFRLTHTFTIMFGSPSSRVFYSVPAIAFSWVLFIWPHKFRARLLYYSQISFMCLVLSLGPLWASEMGLLRKYFTVLPIIHYHKGLHATCSRGSVIHLWYLSVLLFSYHYCYISQGIYVSDNIMSFHSFSGI